MKTKQQVIEQARALGSSAETFRGAYRFLRGRTIQTKRGLWKRAGLITELPRGFMRVNEYGGMAKDSRIVTAYGRTVEPAEVWHIVSSRKRWNARMERLAREVMSGGHVVKFGRRRRRMPLLDRDQYAALAEVTAETLGLPDIETCERISAELTQPWLDRARAALEAKWPYRKSISAWAGGEHTVTVVIGDHTSAECSTEKVWSSNGRWSGSNSHARIVTNLETLQNFPTLMTSDGLALCRARKIGPREFEVRWIEQSIGVSLKTVDGYLVRGYHVRGRTIEEARRKAAAERTRALTATLRERADRRAKRLELAEVRNVYLDLADSFAAGNCRPSSEQFARQIWEQLGAVGPCAVRADVVLEKRDDVYTRRTLGAAVGRMETSRVAA